MQHETTSFWKVSLVAAACTILVACGGGGGGSSSSSENGAGAGGGSPETPPVSNAPMTVEQQKSGLSLLADEATGKTVVMLSMNAGDTWRLTFTPDAAPGAGGTYQAQPIVNAYGSDAEGFTGSYRNTADIWTDAPADVKTRNVPDPRFQLIRNSNTGIFSGEVTGFGRVPDGAASGTPYVAKSLSDFKGTYFFSYASHNVNDKSIAESGAGQLRVSADGTKLTVCNGGLFINDKCTPVVATESAEEVALTLERGDDQIVRVKKDGKDFGVWNPVVSELGGYSFSIDHLGLNDPNIMRTGMFYASSATTLKSGDLDGSFSCSGTDATLTIKGDQVQINSSSYQGTETLFFNTISDGKSKDITVNGVVESRTNGDRDTGRYMQPFTKDMLVIENENNSGLLICARIPVN